MTDTPIEIVTERLTLRPFTVEGAQAMVDGVPPAGVRWAEGWPPEADRGVAAMYLRNPATDELTSRFGAWEIHWNATGEFVGGIGLFGPPNENGTTEVGYGVAPSYQRKGIATEALLGLIAGNSAYLPSWTTVVASTDHDNPASQKVLDKAGFTFTHADDEKRYYTRPVG